MISIPDRYSYITNTLKFIEEFKHRIDEFNPKNPKDFLQNVYLNSFVNDEDLRDIHKNNIGIIAKMIQNDRCIYTINTSEDPNNNYEFGFLITAVNTELSEILYKRFKMTLNVVCASLDSCVFLLFMFNESSCKSDDPDEIDDAFNDDNYINKKNLLEFIKNSGKSSESQSYFYHVY